MSVGQELRDFFRLRIVQLGALVLLLTVLGALSITIIHSVHDPDVWWHLKVGDWIRQTHTVPHTGIFSRTAAERPWVAYSWGYEVLLSFFYLEFGLMGIGLNGLMLTVLVAALAFWSAHRLSHNFWLSVLLTAISCCAYLYLMMPRPAFFSMMLFAILITLLLECQRTGQIRGLYWLPLVFCLWANLHIQFVYGLFVLGLFAFVRTVHQLIESRFGKLPLVEAQTALPLPLLWIIVASCFAAGCIGPYGPRLYEAVLNYSRAKVTYSMIIELMAPRFDGINEYLELLLAAAGFFALGWRKRIDVFKALLLVAAAASAFRTLRDAWFLCMISVACIAEAFQTEQDENAAPPFRLHELAVVTASVLFCLFLVAKNADFTPRRLDRITGSFYPVNAVNFIRQNPLPGPMFNSFDWGGFLIWYMPGYPVSIDGRNDLYGDDLDSRLYEVEAGESSYEKEPLFAESRLILLQNHVPLAKALAVDPAYEEVYRDRIAVIYVHREAPTAAAPNTLAP